MSPITELRLETAKNRVKTVFRKYTWVGLLTAATGFLLVLAPLGDPLARLSYDLPFCFKANVPITNIALVYVDEETLDIFGRLPNNTLSRTKYTELLRKLTAQGAKLVFFDFIMSSSSPEANVDEELAQAIQKHGNVLLASAIHETGVSHTRIKVAHRSVPVIAKAARAQGHVELFPDPDRAIRRISNESGGLEYAMAEAAKILKGSSAERSAAKEPLWLNYYGVDGALVFNTHKIQTVLTNLGVPADLYQDQIVFVGVQSHVYGVGETTKDRFVTPYTLLSGDEAPGLEIHATALANYLRGDFLRKMPLALQLMAVGVWGLALGLGLMCLRRQPAFLVFLLVVVAATVISFLLQWYTHSFWPWMVAALVQPIVALQSTLVINPWRIARPMAFISYRRSDGASYAAAIRLGLREQGREALMDVTALHSGLFPDQLRRQIESVPNFILICSPQTLGLERENWVVQELEHAYSKQRNVIPVYANAQMQAHAKKDPFLARPADHQGVEFSIVHFGDMIKKVLRLCSNQH